MRAALKGTVLNMQPTNIKGIVHPKMYFLSLFTHSHVVPNLYSLLSCAERRRLYFGEHGKPNSCWSTLTLIEGEKYDRSH